MGTAIGEHDLSQITEEFALGELLQLAVPPEGNAPARYLRTSRGEFLVKAGVNRDWAELYRIIEGTLNARSVRQARILPTRSGELVMEGGIAVFEWLPGRTVARPNDQQFLTHIDHLAAYNAALRQAPLAPCAAEELRRPDGLWKKAASIEYLLECFRLDPVALAISLSVEATAARALAALAQERSRLLSLPRQLIHSDIGPGNILFDGEQVISIIDFTPAYEPHLYSLCISLFWHCIFIEEDGPAQTHIASAFHRYAQRHGLSPQEHACFFPLMLRAVAYRLFARLIARQEHGIGPNGEAPPFSAGSTERMAGCADRVLEWEGFLRRLPYVQ